MGVVEKHQVRNMLRAHVLRLYRLTEPEEFDHLDRMSPPRMLRDGEEQ